MQISGDLTFFSLQTPRVMLSPRMMAVISRQSRISYSFDLSRMKGQLKRPLFHAFLTIRRKALQ